MKVTLDIDRLLSGRKITRKEYEKIKSLSAGKTSTLAFNVLTGFGVVALAGGLVAFLKSGLITALLGLIAMLGGLILNRKGPEKWQLLGIICILTGALMTAGGVLYITKGSVGGFVTIGIIYAVAAIYAGSSLLAILLTSIRFFDEYGVMANSRIEFILEYKPSNIKFDTFVQMIGYWQ